MKEGLVLVLSLFWLGVGSFVWFFSLDVELLKLLPVGWGLCFVMSMRGLVGVAQMMLG